MKKISQFFTDKSGNKRIFKTKRIFFVLLAILLVGGIWGVLQEGGNDTSTYTESNQSPPETASHGPSDGSKAQGAEMDGFFVVESESHQRAGRTPQRRPSILKYRAKQVIVRKGATAIPTGTTAAAILASAVDTRDSGGFVRAFLPDGVRFEGQTGLPPQTLLLGNFSYEGRGRKVLLKFIKAILPKGREFSIQARATLEGEHHSNRAGKTAMVLGLTMASGMADVLAQKQALSQYGDVTVKSSMKNAFYHGAAKATEMEAQRQEREIGELPPYVTVDKGTAFTVVFTAPLKSDLE